MKMLKVMALIAVLLGSGAAFATKSNHRFAVQNYRNTGTLTSPVWVPQSRMKGTEEEPGTYRCDSDPNYCTAHFNSTPSPGAIPTDFENGIYVVN